MYPYISGLDDRPRAYYNHIKLIACTKNIILKVLFAIKSVTDIIKHPALLNYPVECKINTTVTSNIWQHMKHMKYIYIIYNVL